MFGKKFSSLKSAFLFLVFLILTVVFGIIGMRHVVENQALQKEGIEAQGKVISMSVSNTQNVRYKLVYSFLVNYAPKRGTDSVTKPFYDSLTIGSSIPVTYVKSNPGISRTRFSVRRDARQSFMIVGLNIAIMAFMVCFLLFKRFFLRID